MALAFAKKLARKQLGQKKIVPFTKFGTAIIPNKKMNIEVATARTESYSQNSRKPTEVIYTILRVTWHEEILLSMLWQ